MQTFNSKRLEKNSNIIEIDDIYNDLIRHIYLCIKDEHKISKNELIMELPFYFEKLALINNSDNLDIKDVRLIIWGKILENLNENFFQTQLSIDEKNEKCFLCVKWASSYDKYKKDLSKYKAIISKSLV